MSASALRPRRIRNSWNSGWRRPPLPLRSPRSSTSRTEAPEPSQFLHEGKTLPFVGLHHPHQQPRSLRVPEVPQLAAPGDLDLLRGRIDDYVGPVAIGPLNREQLAILEGENRHGEEAFGLALEQKVYRTQLGQQADQSVVGGSILLRHSSPLLTCRWPSAQWKS